MGASNDRADRNQSSDIASGVLSRDTDDRCNEGTRVFRKGAENIFGGSVGVGIKTSHSHTEPNNVNHPRHTPNGDQHIRHARNPHSPPAREPHSPKSRHTKACRKHCLCVSPFSWRFSHSFPIFFQLWTVRWIWCRLGPSRQLLFKTSQGRSHPSRERHQEPLLQRRERVRKTIGGAHCWNFRRQLHPWLQQWVRLIFLTQLCI